MKITSEIGIADFNAWSGAVETKEAIVNAGKCDEFDALIEDCYPEGLTNTGLNDILWFQDDWIFEALCISKEEDDE